MTTTLWLVIYWCVSLLMIVCSLRCVRVQQIFYYFGIKFWSLGVNNRNATALQKVILQRRFCFFLSVLNCYLIIVNKHTSKLEKRFAAGRLLTFLKDVVTVRVLVFNQHHFWKLQTPQNTKNNIKRRRLKYCFYRNTN